MKYPTPSISTPPQTTLTARQALKAFETPTLAESLPIALGTLGLYLGYLILAIGLVQQPGILAKLAAVAVAVLAGMLLVRVFIIQHDCGHGSFTPSPKLNRAIGRIASGLTLTPFQSWAMGHNQHHANFANLHKASVGEVELLSAKKYQSLSVFKRFYYRFYRHPLTLIFIAPYYLFLLRYRLETETYAAAKKSTYLTNLGLLALYAPAAYWLPWQGFAMIMLAWYVAGLIGVLLFYIQHNYPQTKYHPKTTWNFERACAESCSYLVLLNWLNWFSGNIAYHHLHHLSSKVPFYRLTGAQAAMGHLVPATRLTLADVLPALHLALWSEKQQRIIPFSEMLLAGE